MRLHTLSATAVALLFASCGQDTTGPLVTPNQATGQLKCDNSNNQTGSSSIGGISGSINGGGNLDNGSVSGIMGDDDWLAGY